MSAAASVASTSGSGIAFGGVTAVLSEKSRSGRHGWMVAAIAGLKEFGPYAAILLVLPGGSVIAMLLWLHRRRRFRREQARVLAARYAYRCRVGAITGPYARASARPMISGRPRSTHWFCPHGIRCRRQALQVRLSVRA
jgi:hypothetical protein